MLSEQQTKKNLYDLVDADDSKGLLDIKAEVFLEAEKAFYGMR